MGVECIENSLLAASSNGSPTDSREEEERAKTP